MNKYSAQIYSNNKWETIAVFSNACDIYAMVDFCNTQFANGNSLTAPAEDICITDMETGEVLWSWLDESMSDDEPDVDECGYDPYMGCYTDDC